MRELKECRKEIFRRSEKRLQRRSQIMRTIGTTVWACSILLIFPLIFGSGLINTGRKGVHRAEQERAYIEISDSYGLYYRKISLTTKVTTIYTYMNELVKQGASIELTYDNPDYNITYTDTNGDRVDYILDNHTLICWKTRRQIVLTEQQLLEIKEVLELSP